MTFSCILIGEDNLLIECGNFLLDNDWQIKWVISDKPSIEQWASLHQINCVTDISKVNKNNSPIADYLFSIVNGKILKKADISLASIYAINYHDALLPKYAGVHATSWAIYNGEKKHGITWHTINEAIDEGDILYQSSFDISESDTALTLNLRCFEEALVGFKKIITTLVSNEPLKVSPQKLEEKTYYGRYHPLPNLGFIDWSKDCAKSIHQKCRSLDFGQYPNNLGLVKVKCDNGNVLSVTKSKVIDELTFFETPGIILTINHQSMVVATLKGSIELFFNNELTTLKVGDCLADLSVGYLEDLKPLYISAMKNESFWHKGLLDTSAHGIFNERVFAKNKDWQDLPVIYIDDLSAIENFKTILLSAISLYFYRINNYEALTLYITHCSDSRQLTNLFADWLPFNVQLDSDDISLKDYTSFIESKMKIIGKKGIVLKDITDRQPSLKHYLLENDNYKITINLSSEKDIDLSDSLLHFNFDTNESVLHISHRIDLGYQGGVLQSLVANMPMHIKNIFDGFIKTPDVSINQLNFLVKKEYIQLLNQSVGEYKALPSITLIDLFERQVNHQPQKIVFDDNGQKVSMNQLLSKTNTIYHHLNQLKQQHDIARIAIDGKHLSQLLPSFLAIVKAGFVCELLSDAYESEFVVFSLQQTNGRVITKAFDALLSDVDNNHKSPIDASFSKGECLCLPGLNEPITQDKLINYCFWLANNEASLIDDNKSTNLQQPISKTSEKILLGLAAVLTAKITSFSV